MLKQAQEEIIDLMNKGTEHDSAIHLLYGEGGIVIFPPDFGQELKSIEKKYGRNVFKGALRGMDKMGIKIRYCAVFDFLDFF
ncbi:MAG: hypothetical protein J7J92_00900 [Candidatus Aenigmarchaeota archaeon]|nr:hypothetical protein [Candidatus Aenigmarchaeota archaeon]